MLPQRRTRPESTRGLAPGRGWRSLASPIPHPKRPPARAERSGLLRFLLSPIGIVPMSQVASAHSAYVFLWRPRRNGSSRAVVAARRCNLLVRPLAIKAAWWGLARCRRCRRDPLCRLLLKGTLFRQTGSVEPDPLLPEIVYEPFGQ